jgi:hypothetical protein
MIACGKSNAIVLIEVETLEPTKQIKVKQMPWGQVTYPKSMCSLDTKIEVNINM